MSLSSEAKKEVERFLLDGQKIAAIKYLADSFAFSFQESKILVEAVEQTLRPGAQNANSFSGAASLDEPLRGQLGTILKSGQKIEAIKHAKKHLNISLKHAKDLVEKVERETSANRRSGQRNVSAGAPAVLLWVFVSIGLIFLGVAGVIYFRQSESIGKSDLVKGRVIRMATGNDKGSAPVIAYEWRGKKWLYASNTYSSPPAYSVNEEVPMYVNREDPTDITVDTFVDRYLLITIFGVMGFLFAAIPCGVMFLMNKP